MIVRLDQAPDAHGWHTINDDAGAHWGAWHPHINLANEHSIELLKAAPRASHLITWSGWLADDPFERDPRTWGPGGLHSLDAGLRTADEIVRDRSAHLLLRPHARHILCDPQRCLAFLREDKDFRAHGAGLALDIAAMLEADQLDEADDHVERAAEALVDRAGAVWLTALEEQPATGEFESPPPPLIPAQNAPRERLIELTARYASTTPLVLIDVA